MNPKLIKGVINCPVDVWEIEQIGVNYNTEVNNFFNGGDSSC